MVSRIEREIDAMHSNDLPKPPARWLRADGSTVACTESVKVLAENWAEAAELLQSMYEDAVLLGVAKSEYKKALHALVDALDCPYEELTAPPEKTGAPRC